MYQHFWGHASEVASHIVISTSYGLCKNNNPTFLYLRHTRQVHPRRKEQDADTIPTFKCAHYSLHWILAFTLVLVNREEATVSAKIGQVAGSGITSMLESCFNDLLKLVSNKWLTHGNTSTEGTFIFHQNKISLEIYWSHIAEPLTYTGIIFPKCFKLSKGVGFFLNYWGWTGLNAAVGWI